MPFWSRRKAADKPVPTALPTITPGDWASVTTPEQVQALTADGILEPLLLMPEEFGGIDLPMNVVPVPRGIVALRKQTVLSMVNQMIADGTADSYTTDVEYRGDSQIPAALHIHVTKDGSGGGFHPTLSIW